MASDILITPNKGSAVTNAKIEFTGATSESSTMRIEALPNGALSFIGSSNVGIGTTSPGAKLEVDLNVAAQTDGIRLKNSNTGGYGHELNFNLYGYAGSTVGSFDVLSMRTQYNGTTGYVTFLTKAQPQSTAVQSLFLQGDGSVGIGTASPTYHLQVAGTGTQTSVASFRYDTGIIGEVGILSDATGGLLFARDGSGTSNTQINGKTNGHSYFNSGGSVCIGTTTPFGKFQLGPSNAVNTPISDILQLRYYDGNFYGSSAFHYYDSGQVMDKYVIGVSGIGGTLTGPNTIAQAKMVIQANGNVGIGTTGPGAKLNIAGSTATLGGTIAATTLLRLNPSADVDAAGLVDFQSGWDNPTNSSIFNLKMGYYLSGNLTRDVITAIGSTGNVGIGTTSPTGNLEIAKTASGALGANLFLRNNAAVAVGNAVQISMCANSGGDATAPTGKIVLTEASNAYSKLGFFTYAADGVVERLTIANGGNVGVGTTGPTSKLFVKDSTGGNASLTYTASAIATFAGPYTSLSITGQNESPFGLAIQTRNANESGSAYHLSINPLGGDVGIGTASLPTNKLTIVGSSNQLGIGDGTYRYDIGYDNSYLRFKNSAGDTQMVVNWSTGNVGIGTTSPGARLDIVGAGAQPNLRVTSSSWGDINNAMVIFDSGSTGDGKMLRIKNYGARNDMTMFDVVNSVGTVFAIRGDGNVGIGTTAPGQKLEIVESGSYAAMSVGNGTNLSYLVTQMSLVTLTRMHKLVMR